MRAVVCAALRHAWRLIFAVAAVLLPSLIATVPALAQTSNGCEDAIGSWQELAGKESQDGHIDDSVYNKIKAEIEQATEGAEPVRMRKP